MAGDDVDPRDPFRQFFALERDVLVLSLAMYAFSLGVQMTSRYLPEYLTQLGASAFVVGLFGTVGNVVADPAAASGARQPLRGGTERGSRRAGRPATEATRERSSR